VQPECNDIFEGCKKRDLPIYSKLTSRNYWYHPKCTQSIFGHFCNDVLPTSWIDVSNYVEIEFTEEDYNSCIENFWCGSSYDPPNYSNDDAYYQAWWLEGHIGSLDLLIDSVLNSGHCNDKKNLGGIRTSTNECVTEANDIQYYELFDILDPNLNLYISDVQDIKVHYQPIKYIPDNLNVFESIDLLSNTKDIYLYKGCLPSSRMSFSDFGSFQCSSFNGAGIVVDHSVEGTTYNGPNFGRCSEGGYLKLKEGLLTCYTFLGNKDNENRVDVVQNVKDIWNDKYLEKWVGYNIPPQSDKTLLEVLTYVNEPFVGLYPTYEQIFKFLECTTCSMNPSYKYNLGKNVWESLTKNEYIHSLPSLNNEFYVDENSFFADCVLYSIGWGIYPISELCEVSSCNKNCRNLFPFSFTFPNGLTDRGLLKVNGFDWFGYCVSRGNARLSIDNCFEYQYGYLNSKQEFFEKRSYFSDWEPLYNPYSLYKEKNEKEYSYTYDGVSAGIISLGYDRGLGNPFEADPLSYESQLEMFSQICVNITEKTFTGSSDILERVFNINKDKNNVNKAFIDPFSVSSLKLLLPETSNKVDNFFNIYDILYKPIERVYEYIKQSYDVEVNNFVLDDNPTTNHYIIYINGNNRLNSIVLCEELCLKLNECEGYYVWNEPEECALVSNNVVSGFDSDLCMFDSLDVKCSNNDLYKYSYKENENANIGGTTLLDLYIGGPNGGFVSEDDCQSKCNDLSACTHIVYYKPETTNISERCWLRTYGGALSADNNYKVLSKRNYDVFMVKSCLLEYDSSDVIKNILHCNINPSEVQSDSSIQFISFNDVNVWINALKSYDCLTVNKNFMLENFVLNENDGSFLYDHVFCGESCNSVKGLVMDCINDGIFSNEGNYNIFYRCVVDVVTQDVIRQKELDNDDHLLNYDSSKLSILNSESKIYLNLDGINYLFKNLNKDIEFSVNIQDDHTRFLRCSSTCESESSLCLNGNLYETFKLENIRVISDSNDTSSLCGGRGLICKYYCNI
jgi:hypothetical protein